MAQKIPVSENKKLLGQLGQKAGLWNEITGYLAESYGHVPVLTREGKDRTLTIRYRKGGKTLVTLYPREAELVVLVVLGKEEVAKARKLKLTKNVKATFEKAKQFHDGRWLWLKPANEKDLESIFLLLNVKRKPKE
jgi:hypothetical protein